MESYDLSKLIEISNKLSSLLSRKLLVGQYPTKLETSFAILVFNKQFKNTFDSQTLNATQTWLTLPSTLSQSLQSVSIRKPVHYLWVIFKDVSQYIPTKQMGKTLSIVSDLSSIQFSSAIANFSTPIIHSLPLKQTYNEAATYSCVKIENNEVVDTSCKFSYSEGNAKCECTDNIMVGVLSSIPIEIAVQPSNRNTSNKESSDLLWILWGLLLFVFVVIAFVGLGIFGYCVMQRMKPSLASYANNGIELKSV